MPDKTESFGEDESKIVGGVSTEHADGTKSEQELVLVRAEIAENKAKLDALVAKFEAATTPTQEQFFSKRVEATEAELATLRDREDRLLSATISL